MPFKPKTVTNDLSVELATLRKELEATGLVSEIETSTLLVYSALKSGITDTKTISEAFCLNIKTVQTQLQKLLPVKCQILKIYKKRSTKLRIPIINITIQMLPNFLQEQIIEIPEEAPRIEPTLTVPIPIPVPILNPKPTIIPAKPIAPISKKEKLKGFQM
jgi:hypothetical protein